MKDLETMEELDIGMSNFDGLIEDGLAEALKLKPAITYAQHSAWNFCGYVWFENGRFVEQVWRYNSPVDELTADTLEDLMEEVNGEYGYG